LSKLKKAILIALPIIGAALVILNYYFVPDKNDIFVKKWHYPAVISYIPLQFLVKCLYFKLQDRKLKRGTLKNTNKLEEYLEKSPRILAMLLFFTLWDVLTAKLGIISSFYFPDGSRIVGAITKVDKLKGAEWKTVGLHILNSLRLLFTGYFAGLAAGFITGAFAGWFPKARYWIMPIVKKIGPIPSTIWLPIFVSFIPGFFAVRIVIIAFGVWFPASLMTATGIMAVPSSYFEVAKTLGAKKNYLLFKVALPATMPSLFMGMFMGMSISCVALISAESIGAKSGLGFFITNAISWGEYNKVYAGVIIILLIFSTVISLLFKINTKLLKWQKDNIQW
jgi:NitT/TauT family transport system permease protein